MQKIALVLSAVLLIGFSSCSKDDDNSISSAQVSSTLMSGTWRISYYYDTDHEETSNFTGYNFTFASGNVLTAVNGANTVTGTWASDTDNSQAKLVLVFASPANFAELSEDWHVIERTGTKISLEHVSGGNGGTDRLTFERN